MSLSTLSRQLNISLTGLAALQTLRLVPPSRSSWRGSCAFSSSARTSIYPPSISRSRRWTSPSLGAHTTSIRTGHVKLGRQYFSSKVPGRPNDPWPFKVSNDMPHYVVVGGILAANIMVWFVWKTIKDKKEGYVERFRMMDLVFIEEGSTLWGERPWTIITSSFSHFSGNELCRDIGTILLVAFPISKIVGNSLLLAIYLSGGAASRLARYVQSIIDPECLNLTVADRANVDSIGAVGALMSSYVCLMPFIKRWLAPTHFTIFCSVYIALNGVMCCVCLFTRVGDNFHKVARVESAGWLAGTATGVLLYFFKIRPQLYRHLPYRL